MSVTFSFAMGFLKSIILCFVYFTLDNLKLTDAFCDCPEGTTPFSVTSQNPLDDINVFLRPNKNRNAAEMGLLGSSAFITMKGLDKYNINAQRFKPFILKYLGLEMKRAKNVRLEIYDPENRRKRINILKVSPKKTGDWSGVNFKPRSIIRLWTSSLRLRFVATRGGENSWDVKDLFLCGCVQNSDTDFPFDYIYM